MTMFIGRSQTAFIGEVVVDLTRYASSTVAPVTGLGALKFVGCRWLDRIATLSG